MLPFTHACLSHRRLTCSSTVIRFLQYTHPTQKKESAYLLDNEPSGDEGRVAVHRLLQSDDLGAEADRWQHEMGAARSDEWLPRLPRHVYLACRRDGKSSGALVGSA